MMTADHPAPRPTRANLFSKCKEFPGGRQIEVAPGKTVFPAPDDIDLPKVALVSWQKIGPSEYRPVVRIHERWVRLTGALPEHLGMGIDYNTLMRLIKAGFVASRRPAPNTTVIDVESWFEHLHASSDPEFWDLRSDPSTRLNNRERYSAVI